LTPKRRDTTKRPLQPARLTLGLAGLVLLAFGAGCSTGDDAGGFQQSCLTFLATKAPIDGEVTSVWGSESTCDVAEVELVIPGGVDVQNVWAASFDVTYDNSLAVFWKISATDSFLTQDGNPLLLNQGDDQNGKVVFGVTRTDSTNNIGVAPLVASTLIARLFFIRIATGGDAPIEVVNADLWKVENPGDPPTKIDPPIVFSGGEFFIEN